MSKGSKQRPRGLVTDQALLDNWDRIFNSKPSSDQFIMVKENHEASLKRKDVDGDT